MNAAELADAAAMFVVVRAKLNLEVLNGNPRRRPPAAIRRPRLLEQLRQLGEVRGHAPGLVACQQIGGRASARLRTLVSFVYLLFSQCCVLQ
jgi:hypothetical protein